MASKDNKNKSNKIVKKENNVKNKNFQMHSKKQFGFKVLFNIIKYSMQGFIHFYKYERSAILHLFVAIAIIVGSIPFKLKAVEWLFMIFILLTMLAIELLNTAIEAVCDLVSPEYNQLVKVAKDCGSAATFSISIGLVIAILILYVPKVLSFFGIVM